MSRINKLIIMFLSFIGSLGFAWVVTYGVDGTESFFQAMCALCSFGLFTLGTAILFYETMEWFD